MGATGEAVARRSKSAAAKQSPRSLEIAENGVNSSGDFRNLMSALMTDVIRGSLTPEVTNAACNAGGKLLKMVELEYKYATDPERRSRNLTVAFDAPVAVIEPVS